MTSNFYHGNKMFYGSVFYSIVFLISIVFSRIGLKLAEEPSYILSISKSAECESRGRQFCFLSAVVGGRATLPVSVVTDNNGLKQAAVDDIDRAGSWVLDQREKRVTWYKYYAGLPPYFHSFRQRFDISGTLLENMHLDDMGQTLTISPIRPDDLYEARYVAEIAPSEDVEMSPNSDIEVFDLSEGERLHPWDTRVFFALETVAIELGPFLRGDPLQINIKDFLETHHKETHYRWAIEGAIQNFVHLNVPLSHAVRPTLAVSSLDDDLLGTTIIGIVYGKAGRIPGRVAIGSQRFLIKKDESRVCHGRPTNRTCTCNPGYELDGAVCKDVDECFLGIGRCFPNSTCHNVPGSYRCNCPFGYHGDGISSCQDIDECAIHEGHCDEHAVCVNTLGSYRCLCQEGYTGDGFDCLAVSEWTHWLPWSACSGSCGRSSRTRYRDCSHPESGMICDGPSEDSEPCVTTSCPVDGGWADWSPWSVCSESCSGHREMVRACDNPTPANGGLFCIGEMYTIEGCGSQIDCPVDGGWSQWTEWYPCSTSCGPGYQTRRRSCDSPPPGGTGRSCDGYSYERRNCSRKFRTCFDALVGAAWGLWERWSTCSQPCGIGQRLRTRQCHTTSQSLGPGCSGARQEQQPCFRRKC